MNRVVWGVLSCGVLGLMLLAGGCGGGGGSSTNTQGNFNGGGIGSGCSPNTVPLTVTASVSADNQFVNVTVTPQSAAITPTSESVVITDVSVNPNRGEGPLALTAAGNTFIGQIPISQLNAGAGDTFEVSVSGFGPGSTTCPIATGASFTGATGGSNNGGSNGSTNGTTTVTPPGPPF